MKILLVKNVRRSRVKGRKGGDANELSHNPGARQSPPKAVQCIHRVDTLFLKLPNTVSN